MRITNSMHFRDMYGENNKVAQSLFDVNKQIASGRKIQYAHEDTTTFIDTMRLDNEVTTLTQVNKSTQSGYKFSTQTDVVLGDFSKTLDAMKVKLVQAASDTNSRDSFDALANDLRGLESHLYSLANTSINGQYLFSGTKTSTKPIDANGMYQGDEGDLKAFLGNDLEQKYNINGMDLFFGESPNTARKITTNVEQVNKVALHPDLLATSINPDEEGIAEYITETDTIRSLMGDTDNDATNDEKSYFYLRGTQHDGTSFKSKIEMSSDQEISDLLHEIGNAYGNTPANDLVTVSLNDRGQVVIEDRLRGSSKLDFHMVGAIDFSGANGADVNDVSTLHAGSTTFPNSGLYINEFVKSSMQTTDTASTISGIEYDKFAFKQSGSILTGSESQILKSDNAYAKDSTKLIDVASGQGDPQTLITQQLSVSGERVGGAAFDMQIDFNPAGATFSLDGGTTNYNIYDMSSPRVAVAADDMTYRQLMDVVNIAMSGELPATTNSPSDYDQAILDSQLKSNVNLNHLGQLSFEDKTTTNTHAKLSIYDTNADIFSPVRASIMTFNTNEALSIRDPKTDFFSQINDAISAVENYNMYSDGNSSDPENIGIQNALQIIDDMNVLVGSKQTKAGSQSQSLQAATDRSTMLLVNTQMLRSEVLDVDIADATLRLQQLSLSYQAMFSSISRISQLSLVNYL